MSNEPGDHPDRFVAMMAALRTLTGVDFSDSETRFQSFITAAESEVQNSVIYGLLLDLHEQLTEQYIVGKIRAIETWAGGETGFRIVRKSWESVIDKLYRINVEDNETVRGAVCEAW